MSEDVRKMIDKVKNFKQFINEQNLNEISSEVRNNAISSMKDKGMDKRAEKWIQFYVDKDLNDFKNKEIFDDKLIIYGFKIVDNINRDGNIIKTLEITYGSPRNQEYNRTHGTLVYYINSDEYSINYEIDRKTAKILSKIATIMNNDSKYSNGIGDFKIKGW
jgi:hypothetical protein